MPGVSTTRLPAFVCSSEPSPESAPPPDRAETPPAERLGFADLARVIAILMMIQGHALDALLSPLYRSGSGFYIWSFIRGLTSCLFLVLAGVVFAVTVHRRQSYRTDAVRAHVRGLRRSGLLLLLGYLLHLPTSRLAELPLLSASEWQSFFAVDVLQCIAISLAVLQVLAIAAGTPRQFGLLSLVACSAVVAITPAVWRIGLEDRLPSVFAPYFSSATGSLFPLTPSAAYVFVGAWLGEKHQRMSSHPTTFAVRALWPAAVAMTASGLICSCIPLQPLGATEFWSTSPNLFLIRAGLVLMLMAGVSHLASCWPRGAVLAQPIAKEALLIYVVHLAIVYGSPWNTGLRQLYGPTLSLPTASAWVAALWVLLAAMAISWNQVKRRYPPRALWFRITAGVCLTTRRIDHDFVGGDLNSDGLDSGQ